MVISSIRNSGEIDRIHDFGGELVWVDADPEIRFERISSRGREDDPKTFNEFEAQQQAEMERSGDEATLNMAEVRERADRVFTNDHGDVESLEKAIETELARL